MKKFYLVAIAVLFSVIAISQNTANYSFTTSTTGSLTDMSTGTTQLLGANIDDTGSPLTSIGFDFFFQGVRHTQFAINENGVVELGGTAQTSTPYKPLAQAGVPIITAYGADQRTHAGDGKVHYKVIGSAPNRTLVIEWLNNQANFNTGGTADLTYQVRLNETSGVIEFVYGSMTMSTLGAADVNSRDPHIGFSSTNTAGNVGSITAPQAGVPTYNGASNDPFENLYVAGTITVLNSVSDGSRRVLTFTPPAVTAPTLLTFTAVTGSGMTLNWIDSPNELLYAIYRSTDGLNYTFMGTEAQNSTSHVASSLIPGTTYFWRVFGVSEGALSTALAGSQPTTAAGNITSAASGLWNVGATWTGGIAPTATDNVTIQAGHTVTINSSDALNLTVQSGGILEFEATTARTLTVTQSVTVDAGGIFRSNLAGTQTGHILSVGENLTSNGTIDFSTNGNTAAAGIVFTGAGDATFTLGGSGATDFKQTAGVTLNKGTNNTPVLTFLPDGLITVEGANAEGFLTITNGTFKISGANSLSNPIFNSATYNIPATGGFWMNNTNATVVGQTGSPTTTGLLRMTLGILNVGTATDNSMGFVAGSNILIEGGFVISAGRFGITVAGNAITYNQTGGTITVCTIGNTSTSLASFDLGTGVGTTNITGGTIVVRLANTAGTGPRDYRNQSGLTGTTTVTGGTVQFGDAASGAAKAYSAAGVFPNLVIDNSSAGHSVTLLAPAVFNNVTKNITINTGTTLNVGNNVFLMNGTNLTNNGTLTANGASSNFVWFLTTSPVLYTGTGVVTAPMTNFAMQANMGLTIDLASPNIVVGAIRLFSGSITNSNKITLGNGGVTTGIVQIGNTTTPTDAGTFDVPFTFNLGTGGQTVTYLRTTLTRTTGPEINPTRILTSMTYDDNDITHALTIAGGDITVSSAAVALTMTNGRIITGANNLIISSGTATVTRINGYVDGNFRKTFAAAGSKNFEVGTANGYSPVEVNMTAGFPTTFDVKAVQGPQPNIGTPALALQRYWTLNATGVTADLTFNYLDPTDISGNEAAYVIVKYDGAFTTPGGTVNTAANQATITGVTSFSDWTLAEPAAICTAPTVNAPTVTQPTCATPTGTIVVNVPGVGPFDYTIDNGGSWQPTNSYSGLAPGPYNIGARLQATPACVTMYASNPVTINAVPTPPTVIAPIIRQPTCFTMGTIVVNSPDFTFSGVLDAGDPTNTVRIQRDGIASTCTTEACPGNFMTPGAYQYDTYSFVNPSASPRCITVTLVSPCSPFFFVTAYLNSFNPANLCTNYLGDLGGSPVSGTGHFRTTIPGSSTVVIVVNVVSSSAFGCGAYTVHISNADENKEYSIDAGGSWQASNTFTGLASGNYDLVTRSTADPSCMTSFSGNPVTLSGACVTYTFSGTGSYNTVANWAPSYPGTTIEPNEHVVIAPGAVCTISTPVTNNGLMDNTGTLINNSTLTNNASFSNAGGTYGGSGIFTGSEFDNTGGNVAPGASPGCTAFLLGYNQGGGTETIEIGGLTPCTLHDQLNVTGTTTLSGTLDVVLFGGFVPTCGQSFTIMTNTGALPVVGTFAIVNFPAIPAGMQWRIEYDNPTNGSVTLFVDNVVAGDIIGATNSTICANQSTNVDIDLTGTAPFNGVFNIDLQSGSGASSVYNWTAVSSGISAVTIPAANLTNTGSTNTTYLITWNALGDANGCTITAPDPRLTGSVLITVEPRPDIAAVPNHTIICNGGTLNITVSNPNGVGGTYTRTGSYPVGIGHSALNPPQSLQPYGVFTDILTNSTAGPLVVTYTFTPDGPGTLNCPGAPVTVLITVTPPPTITCQPNQLRNTDPNVCTYTAVGTEFDNTGFAPATCNSTPSVITYTSAAVPGPGGPGGVAPATGGATLAGAVFQKGTTTITWRVTDGVGNTAECSFNVTVLDAQAPTITCPGDAIRNTNTNLCTYTAVGNEFNPVSSSDNCSPVTVTYTSTASGPGGSGGTGGMSPASGTSTTGAVFQKGITTITWTIVDAASPTPLTATCSFTVTVLDAQPPTITCVVNQTRNTDLNLCTYTAAGTEFDPTGFGDNCSPVTVTYTSVASGPGGGLGTGGVAPASGTTTLAGAVFQKGITTITWTITDAASPTPLTATCSFTVTIVDAQAPTITCPANQTRNTDPGVCTYTTLGAEFDPATFDNCAPTTITYTSVAVPAPGAPGGVAPASGTGTLGGAVFQKGVTIITWVVTDPSGNTATCSFTVTVLDNQPPSLACPVAAPFTVNTDPNVCTYTKSGTDWNGSTTDNCGTVFLSYTGVANPGPLGPGGVTPAFGATLNGAVFNKGVTTVTWTAQDQSGNSTTCSYTVTVLDAQAPTVICPANQSLNTAAGVCTAQYTIVDPVTDNCPGANWFATFGGNPNGNPSNIGPIADGTDATITFQKGTTTVIISATDASGNTAVTCSFTVTVTDNQAPSLSCPVVGNINKNTNTGVCSWTVPAGGGGIVATATDNCSPVTITYTTAANPGPLGPGGASPASGTNTSIIGAVFQRGVTTITWSAWDGTTPTLTCSFTVTVLDNQAPTMVTPATQILNVGAGAGCQVPMPDYRPLTLASDNCGVVTLTQEAPNTPGTPVIGYGGARTIVITAQDAAGNSTTITFQVLLVDATPPTATCQNITVFLSAAGTVSITPAQVDGGSVDNCDPVTYVSVVPSSFTCANRGANTVTLTVRDNSGNTSTCTSTVTVVDNLSPVITCPGNQTLFKSAPTCTTVLPDYTGMATATDNCSPVTKTQDPIATTIFAASETSVLVTITATDPAGNTSACTFTVFFVDNTPPVFTSACPNTITANTGAGNTNCYAPVTAPIPTATDNCTPGIGPTTITYVITGAGTTPAAPTSGTVPVGTRNFNVGTTTITYTATDASGNTAVCVHTITVSDNTAPSITCPPTQNANTGAGNTQCSVSVTTVNPNTFDNCGVTTLTWALTGATTDASAPTGINNVGTRVFNVGTTTVTYTVRDAVGNTASCSYSVVVTDNTAPSITCPANLSAIPNAPGCVSTVAVPAPTTSDNCSPTTTTYAITGAGASGPSSGTAPIGTRTFNVGVSTVTYTVTDAAGNTASCSFTVTVTKNLSATICCNATVPQNAMTTSTVTFTGAGGTVPYTFTYDLYVNGVRDLAGPFTVTTVASNPSFTVAQSNAVTGVFRYVLLTVTDTYGCTGTIPAPPLNEATITIVPGLPDLTSSLVLSSSQILAGGTIQEVISIRNVGTSQTTSTITFTVTNYPAIIGLSAASNNNPTVTIGGTTYNLRNVPDWDIVVSASALTFTSKPGVVIAAGGNNLVGITITRGTPPDQGSNGTANQTVSIAFGTGGGETPTSNNSQTTTFLKN